MKTVAAGLARTFRSATGMTRKIAIVFIALGIFGLVLSLRVLIREQWGAVPYSAGGAILLTIGALLYWVSSRDTGKQSASVTLEPASSDDTPVRPQLNNGIFYGSLTASIVVAIVATVILISGGIDPGGIIFLWILFVGFAGFVIARRLLREDHE